MASLMRALIIDGTRSASVRRVSVPVPGPGQVLVDVRRAGICGTDVELFTRELPYFDQGKSSFPLCPGHEWCGTVSAVGPQTDPGWIGVRVTGDTMLGCGHCRRCRSGRHHVCADRYEIGIAGWDGALAEKLLVPAGSLYRLPDAVDDQAGRAGRTGRQRLPGGERGAGRTGPDGPRLGPGQYRPAGDGLRPRRGRGGRRGRRRLPPRGPRGGLRRVPLPGPPRTPWTGPTTRSSTAAATRRSPAGRWAGWNRAAGSSTSACPASPAWSTPATIVLNDITAVGILGASAGLAAAIEHYADGRVDPRPLARLTVGLDEAAAALAGQLDPGAGTKIHVDPRR